MPSYHRRTDEHDLDQERLKKAPAPPQGYPGTYSPGAGKKVVKQKRHGHDWIIACLAALCCWPLPVTILPEHSDPVNRPCDERQVLNNAGGFVFKLAPMDRLRRFLILGSNSNSFYASEKELTLENAEEILALLSEGKGLEIVKEIEAVSLAGRAPRQGPGLFALAIVLVYTNTRAQDFTKDAEKRKARKAALACVPKVCRTASTLYELFAYYRLIGAASKHAPKGKMTGWGSAMRRAIGIWFLEKKPMDVAMQVTKYPQRNGISARDLLRLSHPQASILGKRQREADVPDMALALRYAAHPDIQIEGDSELAAFLRDVQKLKGVGTSAEAVQLIKRHRGLGWEHIGDTKLLKSPRLWGALLDQGLGLTAMIRNLNRFLDIGLLKGDTKEAATTEGMARLAVSEDSWESVDKAASDDAAAKPTAEALDADWVPEQDYLALVCKRLTDQQQLKAGRIHPLRVLMASRMLARKHRSLPPQLAAALDSAFELSFASIAPTAKKLLVAVDISGSMCCGCMGTDCLTALEAAAAVAMMFVRKETDTEVVAFCHTLQDFAISKQDSLEKVLATARSFRMGSTDCSLPMSYARQKGLDVDAFIVLTDNETWRGEHACEMLRQYRASRPPLGEGRQPAKLLVCAFSSAGFSIADPSDPGMLDVAGLDASLPEIMRSFLLGEI